MSNEQSQNPNSRLPSPLLNWTGWILRNTHAEIDGLSYDDGPEWIFRMWDLWLKNSQHGQDFNRTWSVDSKER